MKFICEGLTKWCKDSEDCQHKIEHDKFDDCLSERDITGGGENMIKILELTEDFLNLVRDFSEYDFKFQKQGGGWGRAFILHNGVS